MEPLLVLDAMDADLLVLDDGAYLTRIGPESDSEGVSGHDDPSIDDLLAHMDTSTLMLSSDVLPDALALETDLNELLPPPEASSEQPQSPAKPASDGGTTSDGASSGASSGPSERKATPPPPRRRRQKDELDYLRGKAAELSSELQRLKAREELSERHTDQFAAFDGATAWTSRSVAERTPPAGGKKQLWRRVARSQLESRRRSQRENERLKEVVQVQLEAIQGLEKVLQKRAAIEGTDQWLEDRKRVRVVHDSDAAVFDKLKMDLGVRYDQTAAVFDGNAYAAKRLDGDHVEVKVDGADGMFLEFVASKIVPFDVAETSEMLWKCFTRDQMKLQDGYYSMIDKTDDTLSAKMVLTVRQNNYDVLREAKFVIRRYLAEDHCVFVWACQAETEGTLTKANGMQMFDFGWTRVEPATSPKEGGGGDDDDDELSSTIVQSCARVKIKLPDALEHTQEDVIFLTDLVTGSYMRNLVGIHQTVEDMLVADAISRTG